MKSIITRMEEITLKMVVATIVLAVINDSKIKKATKYLSDKFVVNATRKCFGGKVDKRNKSMDIILKVGAPNFAERKFIKDCKKAHESFPVKNIQLKYFK